ncbi:lysophospholipid acyltransferase family protein [Amycolatopsis suaedae]|uniref:1-acyl-sn-glycerol-3-phosphate acyltransferase n=1 Tax=Amycolatopsis suaedae TaxID=2510978 RepID=A0A4Q7IZQ3_9PSEU|nr:lysophospholipid acyltransferase family protein [Amycolatopsis suaedae]RZQ60541.1 1-acyl-sn-glycerol-3-phosphate acyltransferase [Amycolatopsis suaedae]
MLLNALVGPALRLTCRPAVTGREHLPDGPVILAANHLSFADSVVLKVLSPRRVTFLAKAEYFRGPGRLLFARFTDLPIDRGRYRAARAALDAAAGVLADGRVVGIYPEGTRSPDGRLYRGRTGVGWLALATGAPVVPVGLGGTDRLLPIDRVLPRPHRVTVRFGTPLTFTGDAASGRDRRAVTDEVMAAIGRLSGQESAGRYA